jgi:hypothetical protein
MIDLSPCLLNPPSQFAVGPRRQSPQIEMRLYRMPHFQPFEISENYDQSMGCPHNVEI